MNVENIVAIMSADRDDWDVKDNALEGLNILSKYANKSTLLSADHDIIYAITLEEAVENNITEEDVIQLSRLGWMVYEDSYFSCFV